VFFNIEAYRSGILSRQTNKAEQRVEMANKYDWQL